MSQQVAHGAASTSHDAEPVPPSMSQEDWRRKDAHLVQHLNDLFSPLQFPPELASRILTHASHPDAKVRHNARLSFVGESAPAPRPAAALQPDSVTFQLANFKTTVLNCTVYGPGQRAAFRIVTESAPAACTIIQDNECRNIAMVKWGAHAQVEVRGYAAEQRARDWLKLSSDQRWVVSCVSTEGSHMLTANSTHSRRVMDVRGIEYAWAPMDGFICVSLLQELLAGLFSPLRQR